METSSSSSAHDQHRGERERHRLCNPSCHFLEQLINSCLGCLGLLDDYSAAQYDHLVLMTDPPPETEREMKSKEDEGTRSARGLSLSSGQGGQIN